MRSAVPSGLSSIGRFSSERHRELRLPEGWTTEECMRAVLCNGFHGIKALSIGEAAEPRPGADEVLIDVHAASVSFADHLMICGGYQKRPALPYVPGMDAAGVVVACGENVQRFRPGDRVACAAWFGSLAERMTAKALGERPSSRKCRFRCWVNNTALLSHGLVCLGRSREVAGRRNGARDGRRRRRRLGLR